MGTVRIEKIIKERNSSEYIIILSNQRNICVDEDILVQYRLLSGKEIEEEEIEKWLDTQEIRRAYLKALHYISYRPRSKMEVRQHLYNKDCSPAIVEKAIEKLCEDGYLNDRTFAKAWIDNRHKLRPKGKLALAAELRVKGIDAEIIGEMLNEIHDEDEWQRCYETARKKLKQMLKKPWSEIHIRLGRYLLNKGYEYSLVMDVLEQIKGDCEALLDNGKPQ